jgi:hypothetical protein
MSSYSTALKEHERLRIAPDFRVMMYKYLQHKKTEYILPEIVECFKCMKDFDFEDV